MTSAQRPGRSWIPLAQNPWGFESNTFKVWFFDPFRFQNFYPLNNLVLANGRPGPTVISSVCPDSSEFRIKFQTDLDFQKFKNKIILLWETLVGSRAQS
jgi:hypothetical protein